MSKKIEIPHHIAVVMDGNGRWAKQRGLPRTAGHEAGERVLFELVEAAMEFGVKENERICLLHRELETLS